MLRRLDHVGVVVDDLAEARTFLERLGMQHERDLTIPDRLEAAFYKCGEVLIEILAISAEDERARRLGAEKARIEHIAVEVDDLARTLESLRAMGVRTQAPNPVETEGKRSVWTDADTSDGIVYQIFESVEA